MKTEQIERYLTRQMTDEERAAFEQEMREHPQLAEDVKIVAWTIEAIRERGKQEDEEAIKRMRKEMGSDNKRYYATVAAVIGGVLIVAAMTAVSIPPLYQHVIKPIIESVFPLEEKSEISNPQQPSSLNAPSLDSIASSSDTDSINNVGDDTQGEDQKVANEPQKQEDEPAIEENVKEEPLKEEKAKEDVAKPKEEDVTKAKPKEEKPLPSPVANFSPITKSIGSTKYTLTNLTGNSSGIVTAYVTMINNEKDEMVNIGNFEMVAEGAIGKFQGATFSNGKSKFILHKGETVTIQIWFQFDERPLTASLFKFDDYSTIHDVRYRNLSIQWRK